MWRFFRYLLAFFWGLLGLVWGQDLSDRDPISIRIEYYLVREEVDAEGNSFERFSSVKKAQLGDTIEFRLYVSHEGDKTLEPATVMITSPIPENMAYIFASATPSSERILTEFSGDGFSFSEPPVFQEGEDEHLIIGPEAYRAIRWTLRYAFLPKQQESFFFRVRVLK
ncbi:MAG: hypothetical protein R2880_17845 [Deinococcales bacterium]